MNKLLLALFALASCCSTHAFQVVVTPRDSSSTLSSTLFAATTVKKGGYEPKWKKKQTLADQGPPADFKDIGIIGSIPIVFKQGNVTKTTMAMAGQPLRDVASQAGQFIKYGCGKGECGTCECLMDGKWVRPCTMLVPAVTEAGQELVVTVKAIKSKTTSSGKFYSIKSFLMGFWNNILGMIGFVKFRQAAKKNWDERQEYEDLIAQRTADKKKLKKGLSS